MKIKNIIYGLTLIAAISGLLESCIHNDIPYPRIPQMILEISCEGETSPAQIDSARYEVKISLDESVDITNVTFTQFEFSEGATVDPDLLDGTYNLSTPIVVNVSKYQTYPWLISATQNIERYFEIEGQIGETVIDVIGRRILVKVPETADLANLTLKEIKLGPADLTTMLPNLQPGPIDLSKPLLIAVTAFDRTQEWTVYAEKSALIVNTTAADAWSEVIWVYGNGPADVTNSFQYKESSASEWIDVPTQNISQNQGAFSAFINHLTPLTDYTVRSISGSDIGNEIKVTTQSTEVLPDGSFDQWWLNGKVWCPWDEGGTPFWDTGNKGAATLGQSNVQPSDDTPPGISGKSACLETRFVGIAGIGKLAAGSIYTGSFVKVDGTNGILDFGRPWTVRPTRLRGYMKYTTAPINYASAEYKYLLDRPDSCHIYVALTDWPEPYQIRTNPKNRQLFNPDSPLILGYGELICGENTPGWKEFTIDIKYRNTSTLPRYIQITCAASKYGDYFTGATGATLYVDDFSLLYDIP